MTDDETLVAELQALKLLLLSVASALDDKEAIVERFLKRLDELESFALYASEISDPVREMIVKHGKIYAETILKWNHPNRNTGNTS